MKEFGGLTFSDRARSGPTIFHYFMRKQAALWRGAAAGTALLALSACQTSDEQAQERVLQAQALMQAGDLDGAQLAISEALAVREDGPNFQQLAGVIALQRGDLAGAFRAFTRALENDATNRVALAYVANLGVQTGRVREAEDAADRLLTLEPNAAPALQVKGMLALSRGDLEEAGGYADRLLAQSSASEGGAIIKARVLARGGQAEEALRVIETALRASPDSLALLSNKVQLHRYLKQPDLMAAALGQLAAKDGANATFKLDQVLLYYKVGEAPKAREAALAFLRAGSDNVVDYRTLQRIWWEYDRSPLPAGAARDSSAWADPIAAVYVARYLLTRGELAAARDVTSSIAPKAANLVASMRLRATAASVSAAELKTQVENLLEDDPQNVDALILKAELAQRNGDKAAALEAAQSALWNDPLNASSYILMAQLYRANGADWRARQLFEDGVKKLPQDFQLIEAYTQYLHELGDKGRAMSVARNFARALPSSEMAWSLLLRQCQQAQNKACAGLAENGLAIARTTYDVDDPPGTPPDRGLFGRI